MSITRDSEGLGPASDSTVRNRGYSRPHRNVLSVFHAVLALSPRAQAPEERHGATRVSCNHRARWDPCQPRWVAVASSVQGGAPPDSQRLPDTAGVSAARVGSSRL